MNIIGIIKEEDTFSFIYLPDDNMLEDKNDKYGIAITPYHEWEIHLEDKELTSPDINRIYDKSNVAYIFYKDGIKEIPLDSSDAIDYELRVENNIMDDDSGNVKMAAFRRIGD